MMSYNAYRLNEWLELRLELSQRETESVVVSLDRRTCRSKLVSAPLRLWYDVHDNSSCQSHRDKLTLKIFVFQLGEPVVATQMRWDRHHSLSLCVYVFVHCFSPQSASERMTFNKAWMWERIWREKIEPRLAVCLPLSLFTGRKTDDDNCSLA